MATDELADKIASTLTDRVLALLTDSVFLIAGLLAVGVLISLVWTEFKKAEIRDGEGGDLDGDTLEGRRNRWRLRKFAVWSGTVPAFILLVVFLPAVTPADWPLWAELAVRVVVALCLAPLAGGLSPVVYHLGAYHLVPVLALAWRGVIGWVAAKVYGRRGEIKDTADGGLGFKPDATADDPAPKTQLIDRGKKGGQP